MRDLPSMLISHANVYLPDRIIEDGAVFIKNGQICGIYERGETLPSQADVNIDAEGRMLVPGFVDVHVHGGGGVEAMDASPDNKVIDRMCRFHASHGTTSLLPTTLTATREELLSAIQGIVAAMKRGTGGADVLGIHLEGPYLNPKRSGAQDAAAMQLPTLEQLAEYIEASEGSLRLITMAPEYGDGLSLIPYLVEHGVTVSIGHSDADAENVDAAVRAGATHVTHLFNGMSPLHHREPGVAGSALLHDELAVELICDGLHLHPQVVRLVYQTKRNDRIVLITDACEAAGCPDGNYKLGKLPIIAKDGKAILQVGGNLAGSCLTLDRALVNTMAFTGKSLMEILPGLTINPAKQIGAAERKGSIELGKDGDLVLLSADYEVVRTIVKGVSVYERS
jgi:N-acetylglucosamine-6-phosphate deacetylase